MRGRPQIAAAANRGRPLIRPSADAEGHLLPQGEKDSRADVAVFLEILPTAWSLHEPSRAKRAYVLGASALSLERSQAVVSLDKRR